MVYNKINDKIVNKIVNINDKVKNKLKRTRDAKSGLDRILSSESEMNKPKKKKHGLEKIEDKKYREELDNEIETPSLENITKRAEKTRNKILKKIRK